jgi:hypothetical protein
MEHAIQLGIPPLVAIIQIVVQLYTARKQSCCCMHKQYAHNAQ